MNKKSSKASLALLTIPLIFLLVACGSKKSTTASTASTSQASNSETQATMTPSNNSKESTTSKTSEAQSSSEETVPSTSESAPTEPSSEVNYNEVIPAELIGTWTGKSPQSSSVIMTIARNGLITSTVTDNTNTTQTMTVVINSLDVIAPNTYFVTNYSGDFNAFLPGVSSLGGAGYKVAFGFKIENGQLIPVNWIAPESEQYFDYNNIHNYGYALSKQ